MSAPAPRDCDHDSLMYVGTDTQAEADGVIYVEYQCEFCDALVSNVYETTGRQIVFPADEDEPFEITTEADGGEAVDE